MTQIGALLVFVSLITFISGCTFNSDDHRARCSSYEDLELAGSQTSWIKLNLVNSGNESLAPIKSGLFKNTPNVQDLQVKQLANKIEPGAFDGLEVLYELHLDDNKLHEIPPRAFYDLLVEVIYIYFCEVKEIKPGAFDNVPNLKYVYMYGNQITTIRAGVFNSTRITHLVLRNNKIKYVEDDAFKLMRSLVHLSLEENEIRAFNPQETLTLTPSLTHLYINRNKLTKITNEMFTVVPRLKVLLLNINSIRRLGDKAFHKLPELQLLDISNNRLEEIQINVFPAKGLKHLSILFVHDNQLSFISTGALARIPNLRKLSVGGNPWQCPCFNMLDEYMRNNNITKLCYQEYKEGSRPFCVLSERFPNDCILDLENVADVPDLYAHALTEYTKLPRVCNVDGAAQPFLGD